MKYLIIMILALFNGCANTQHQQKIHSSLGNNWELTSRLADKEGDAFYAEMCDILAIPRGGREIANHLFRLGDICIPHLIKALRDDRLIVDEPFPNDGPEPTVRLRAAYVLSRFGNSEGIQALKNVLNTDLRCQREKVSLKYILASALGESMNGEDLNCVRSCLLNAKECIWLAQDVAYMLGISACTEAVRVLMEYPLDIDDYNSKVVRATKDALEWQRNRGKGSFRINPGDSENSIIEKTIRNTLIFDNPDDYDWAIGFDGKRVIFNPQRDRAIADISVGKRYKANRGLDVLLKKSDRGWIVIGVWYSWVS